MIPQVERLTMKEMSQMLHVKPALESQRRQGIEIVGVAGLEQVSK